VQWNGTDYSPKGGKMNSKFTDPEYTPQALLEFYRTNESDGSTCSLLTPMIKAKMKGMLPGQVLEVRVDDPTAKEDIFSWSRMSGHKLLALFEDEPQYLRFYLRR